MNAKHLTKVAGLTSLLMMSSTASAGWDGHFLLGVEGGWAERSGDLSVEVVETAAPFERGGFTRKHKDDGGVWGVLFGYQAICKKLLLGLEGKVSWQDYGERQFFNLVDGDGDLWNVNAEHEMGTVFGLTFRAGYYITDWMMPYLRAGAETSDEKIIFGGTNVTTPSGIAIEDKDRSYRFVGGAGIEFPLWDQAGLRFEYNYSSKGDGAEATGLVPGGDAEAITANIEPHQHAALAAFVWYFK